MKKKDIILVEIDRNLTWVDCKKYLSFLPLDRREKCERYVHDNKKITSLLTSLLIQGEAADFEEIEYTYNYYGKPYIKDKDIYFSVSHSEDRIAYVQSSEEIGIDIEKIKDFNFKVAKKFFTAEENQYIDNSKDHNLAGYQIWTQKEAYLKKIGTGFSDGGYKVNVLDADIQEFMKVYHVKDYMMAVTTNKECNIRIISSKDILEGLKDA